MKKMLLALAPSSRAPGVATHARGAAIRIGDVCAPKAILAYPLGNGPKLTGALDRITRDGAGQIGPLRPPRFAATTPDERVLHPRGAPAPVTPPDATPAIATPAGGRG
ncbi:hypothetical protein, partial [Mesobacterium pallidum]|uniref:hypothetical protein n=1 Tax=Mesobacterium pallidum TaxID=2872037 RepID=UPI001EE164B0